MPRWVLVLDSAIAYAFGFLVATFVHECAHALAAAALGHRAVLHHIHVEHERLSAVHAAIVAGAGPLASLAFGGALWVARRTVRAPMPHLTLTWTALLSLESTFGYLIATPFAPGGDTGAAARHLGFPTWSMLAASAAGAAGIYLTAFLLCGAVRARDLTHAAVLPWALSLGLLVPLHLPAPYWLSLAWPVMSGGMCLLARRVARRGAGFRTTPAAPLPDRIAWRWLFALAVAAALFRGPLAAGIAIGGGR